jgi:hypothetical protein
MTLKMCRLWQTVRIASLEKILVGALIFSLQMHGVMAQNLTPNNLGFGSIGGVAGQGVAGQGVAGQGVAGQGVAGQGVAGQGFAGQCDSWQAVAEQDFYVL